MINYLALALAQEDAEERETENSLSEETNVRLVSRGQILSGVVRLAERDGTALEEGYTAEPVEAGESRTFQDSEEKTEKEAAKEAAKTVARERDAAVTGMVRQLAEKAFYDFPVERLSVREMGETGAAILLNGLRRAKVGVDFTQGQGRRISLTLPGTEESSSGWGPEELDRAVERDARRYDGGFALY
ncbi:MAG: hypothetical protein VB096_00535 [Pseudoflavonifractor sp.]|nr:hypothetical protein [Pseudoflavonifractor sp.]